MNPIQSKEEARIVSDVKLPSTSANVKNRPETGRGQRCHDHEHSSKTEIETGCRARTP